MKFEEKEKEIFFQVLAELTGHSLDDKSTPEVGLTKEQIIKRVGEKITIKRANELFIEFTTSDKIYLDSQKELVFRRSDAAFILSAFLKEQSYKMQLDRI